MTHSPSTLSRLTAAALVAVGLGLSLFSTAQAQRLTPGAIAVGGVDDVPALILSDGQLGQKPTASGLSAVVFVGDEAGNPLETVAEDRLRTIHLPDPDWEITLPPPRGNSPQARGGRVPSSAGATTPRPTPAPAPAPTAAPLPGPSAVPATNTTTNTTTDTPTNTTTNTTTDVTAGASDATAPSVSGESLVIIDETPLAPLVAFERAELDFGPEGVDLTPQHALALDPVVTQMRTKPEEPLRVAAILRLAESGSDAAKLRARQRILAVRRFLLEAGMSTDKLSFVISANTETEPFANFVVIERTD